MYQEVFEIEFLRETEVVYHSEALRMMRDPEFTVSYVCGEAEIHDTHHMYMYVHVCMLTKTADG